MLWLFLMRIKMYTKSCRTRIGSRIAIATTASQESMELIKSPSLSGAWLAEQWTQLRRRRSRNNGRALSPTSIAGVATEDDRCLLFIIHPDRRSGARDGKEPESSKNEPNRGLRFLPRTKRNPNPKVKNVQEPELNRTHARSQGGFDGFDRTPPPPQPEPRPTMVAIIRTMIVPSTNRVGMNMTGGCDSVT